MNSGVWRVLLVGAALVFVAIVYWRWDVFAPRRPFVNTIHEIAAHRSDEDVAREEQARQHVLDICENPDLSARCDQLMAVLHDPNGDQRVYEFAAQKVVECGEAGEARLLAEFAQGPGPDMDAIFILQAWHKSRYKPAIPLLIAYLNRQNEWWKTRSPADRVFAAFAGQNGGAPYHDPRAISFRNMWQVIEKLEDFQARDAKPVIAAIRDQWKTFPFGPNNNFLAVCDQALVNIR